MEARSRHEFEEKLVTRAWQDADFRQRLVSDPSGTVRSEVGFGLPADADIRVIEEPEGSMILVLPAAPRARELSERELDAAAGGSGGWFHTAWGDTCSLVPIYCC
ncbi:hypothetical protein BN12_2730008 [Nostocoides japonicum T1-X7]|uniref:Nitrile hydratase alpha /Thiocyanate hydrolase gamma domain-containing protein n=1 Tax=Nostocoides japonicum T1-X7 TaxID=1194083 RepID=A0A077LWL7_9MICO|nr:NHLP leader peptide family RiPP precursor [Tetrasphaera japonica]CCH78323.1 hypothetical protein BN12_2730008 [Tetrasphaera japonica T1-X7]